MTRRRQCATCGAVFTTRELAPLPDGGEDYGPGPDGHLGSADSIDPAFSDPLLASLWRDLSRARGMLTPLADPQFPADRWLALVDELEAIFERADRALDDTASPAEAATFRLRATALRVRAEAVLSARSRLVTARTAVRASMGRPAPFFSAPDPAPIPAPAPAPVPVPTPPPSA